MGSDNVEPQCFFQFLGAAGVIDMAVCEPDSLQRDAVFADRLQDDVDVAAGIDDHAFLGLAIEQDRTVLLEMRYRDNACL